VCVDCVHRSARGGEPAEALAKVGGPTYVKASVGKGGAEGNRTPVQTYSAKAFYMLILLLFVGNEQETDKPIHRLAGYS
jgi:hypothetical protein